MPRGMPISMLVGYTGLGKRTSTYSLKPWLAYTASWSKGPYGYDLFCAAE